MSRTPWTHLLALAAVIATAVAVVTWRYYSFMGAVPWAVSVSLWVATLVNIFCARRVRSALEGNSIGRDRSQLHPLTVVFFLAIAKASAWTGSIIGGLYAGIATFVIPNASRLDAATNDLVGVISSVVAALCLSVAGLYLERHCETPPPPETDLAR